MAKTNPFRFSTKYQDDETDLLYYGYRYYNASTGRWLSRDPIGEKGFRVLRNRRSSSLDRIVGINKEMGNDYCVVKNDLLNDLDVLGLQGSCSIGAGSQKCKCGEDVTSAIYLTLQNIAETYAQAPWYKKIIADHQMFSGWTASDSWDIKWLKNFVSRNWTPECPCFNTVTFEGRCVSLDELNYIMFGWAIQVCNESSAIELEALENGLLVRRMLYWFERPFGFKEPLDSIGRKVGFADYGSDFSGNFPAWLAWPHDCEPVRDRPANSPNVTDWRWVGLRDPWAK